MHYKVIGGGPAGLYFAYFTKRAHPQSVVRVIEQTPQNATYGFGMVVTDRALEFIVPSAPGVVERLKQSFERVVGTAHRAPR